jgi:hypothetical protein
MSRRKRKGALLQSPSLRRSAHPWGRTAITPLRAVIHKDGFKLTLVKRMSRVAIYRQHLPDGNPDHDSYEVILPQMRHTDHNGQSVAPYEGYPAAESWGKKGWTFTSLAEARQKAQQLAQKASCAGTASRKNRFDGQRRIRGQLIANGPRLVSATKRFALAVGQKHSPRYSLITPSFRS